MSDREKLLAGARRCLYEKGYARTTTRDVVAASSANLASIGYHFGSKEALLTSAILEGLTEWSEMISHVAPPGDGAPMEGLEATWSAIIESFTTHRPLWVASMEAFAQAEHSPELRARLADSYEAARAGLGRALLGSVAETTGDAAASGDPEGDGAAAAAPIVRAVGSFQLAMLGGLTLQWLIDPDRAPSATHVAAAVRAVVALTAEADHAPA